MSVIQVVESKLSNFPEISFESTASSLEVPASLDSGFAVSIYVDGDGSTVHFDGWHERFADDEEAVEVFGFGLGQDCRLIVESKGTKDFRWTVQARADDAWIGDSTTGLLIYPYWKRTSVRYLQNDYIANDV